MSEHILIEQRGHLLLMGFDRADKRNAFTVDMFHALAKAMYRLDQDPELRCGVLHAHGDHFSSGLDLAQWAPRMAEGQLAEIADDEIDPFGLDLDKRCRKPLVMAAQGMCFTLGLELMLNTEIRVGTTDLRLAMLEVKRGFYAVGGATLRLQQEIGWGNAQRVMLTGEELSGQEAYRLGLIQELVEPGQQLERAVAIAESVARAAPLGVQASLNSSRIMRDHGEGAAIARLMPDLQPLTKTDDVREGFRSFVERREANFTGS